jgi:polysaccharide deacetylase family protein (PEP-CTERM system associated)
MSEIVNAMTVDVEDYFHVSVFDGIVPRSGWLGMESRVVANTERLLDLFDEFDTRGTFFVLGWVAERHPSLVRAIAERGHEVASHGYAHRLIYDQTRATFQDDVRRAKQLLEDACGQEVAGFRAPSYSVTPRSLWALDVLIEEGYRYDASIFPIRHDRYGIPVSPREPFPIERPGGSLMEVPGSTVRLGPLNLPVAGGGYFRILPYAWTRWGIARVNSEEQQAAVFYIHPWEIDPDQPRLQAGWLGRFRHYRNLEKTEDRLRSLLTDFRFGTVAALLKGRLPVAEPDEQVSLALPYLW